MIDTEEIRRQFPVLQTTMNGKPLAYLDNAATALKPRSVAEAVNEYYLLKTSNIHRGVYRLSEEISELFEETRKRTSEFIGAESPDQIVFTKNATEGINLVSRSLTGRLKPGDRILISQLEHHANLVPWQIAAKISGAELDYIQVNRETGEIDPDTVPSYFSEKTKFAAITGMSNVTGYRPPVELIISEAAKWGVPVLIDGAQYVSHGKTDVRSLGCDYLVFSAHKLCGPSGLGVLYGKKERLEELEPLIYGGGMIERVSETVSSFASVPQRLEGGTPPIEGVLGFRAAIDFLENTGMNTILEHERRLAKYLESRLRDIPGIRIYLPPGPEAGGGIVSFNLPDLHPHDIGTILDEEGIAVRTGFHCCQPLHRHFRVPGSVRVSFYLYNTEEEAERCHLAIRKALRILS